MLWFDVYCKSLDKYRIYELPNEKVLYLAPGFGRCNILYCSSIDGNKQVPFPEELGLWHYASKHIEPLGNKLERANLYTWEEYALTWRGKKFLKIATVSNHETYELEKIAP